MRKRIIANIQMNEVLIYYITDKYLFDCRTENLVTDEQLIRYIESAYYVNILLDTTKSIFDNQPITSCETFLSDGDWIWSGDLNHYSKTNCHLWPDGFTDSVTQKKYVMPKLNNEKLLEIEKICFDIKKKLFNEPITAPPIYENLSASNFRIVQ